MHLKPIKTIISFLKINCIIYFITFAISSCHKYDDNKSVLDLPINEIFSIYDFSSIDTTDLRGDFVCYENFRTGFDLILGIRNANNDNQYELENDYLWIGIFNNTTKKSIYDYTDYDRPKSHLEYGEIHSVTTIPNDIFHSTSILDDYLIFCMTYKYVKNDNIISDLICIKKNEASTKRYRIYDGKTLEPNYTSYPNVTTRRWCNNIFYLIKHVGNDDFHEYIYDINTNGLLYDKKISYFSDDFLIGLSTDFIVSDTDNKNYIKWMLIKDTINVDIYDNFQKSKSLPLKVFENTSFDNKPDIFNLETINKLDHEVKLKITRITYEGQEENKNCVLLFNNGELSFDIN